MAVFGVVVVLALLALAAGWRAHRPPREGFFWEDFDRPSERSNFSPDAPGSCCGTKTDRAAALEADALRVLAGQ